MTSVNCVGDECLDDITADLVSLTLSDPESSIFNFDTKSLSFRSTPKTNCDSSHVHTLKNTPSNSLLVILNSHSNNSPVLSSTEMLVQYTDVQTSKTCGISSQNVIRDSEALNNKNEKIILPSLEHTASEQNTGVRNIRGITHSHITQDKITSLANCKLSLSLHDVSRLTDFPLKFKSRDFSSDTIQSQSVTTLSSGLKSKDSGLPRTVSCCSLSSGGKSYEHVQSKVKEYIRQIKEADARRKSLKLGDISSKSINADDLNYDGVENKSAASEKTLTGVITGLHNELREREIVVAELQHKYDKLLIKYAEAENKIDHLRFKAGDSLVKQASQKEDHHAPGSEKKVLKDMSKFMCPCKRTSGIRHDDRLLPFDVKYTSNKEIPTYKEVGSSVAQFREGTRQNSTLNSVVKTCSNSVRLEKRVKSLNCNSGAKLTVESFKSELPDISGMSKGKSSSGKTYKSSVTQSRTLCDTDDNISSTASSCQRSMCQGVENVMAHAGQSCEDVCELGFSHSRKCKKMPVASVVRIPDYTSCCNETWLCKKSLEQSEANHPCNSFEKVSRWQESLPPFEFIEPKCYGSLDCHSSGSKTSGQNFVKKFITSGGRDSGCPCSELYSFAVCPNSVKLSSAQAPKCKTDLIGAKDMSSRTEPETVAQPMHHKVAFQSLPYDRTLSGDGRVLDNGDELHLPVSVSYSVKLSECSQNTVMPKLLNINACECWNPEAELSGNSKEASFEPEPCDQKPKNTVQDFDVPPLKLGSLLGGDDNCENIAQSICSSGVTAVSETEETSRAGLYCSIYESSLSSSHQGTSEDITYPSSTYLTFDSQAYKALNNEYFISNKVCPSSSIASDVDNQQQLNCNVLKACSKELETKQYNDVQHLKDYSVASRMNNDTVQDGSMQMSVTASTSYRSIQPYKPIREAELVAAQHCAVEPTILAQTNYHGILNDIPVERERCWSSAHAVDAVKSCMSKRKLLGSTLRYCLLEFLNAENCLRSDCICHRSSRKSVTATNSDHTSITNEDFCVESGGRHISYTGAPVNMTSKVSGMEYGAKRAIATDRVVSSVVEAENQKDLNCDSDRMNDADSTVTPEEVRCNLIKYLHEMDHCAQQLKARSETILNILAVQLKPSL